jgi:hypothetical protein
MQPLIRGHTRHFSTHVPLNKPQSSISSYLIWHMVLESKDEEGADGLMIARLSEWCFTFLIFLVYSTDFFILYLHQTVIMRGILNRRFSEIYARIYNLQM